MNYALIKNGIVTNVIWLYSGNADEFPNAVPMNDIPAGIGDSYLDGAFYRDGVRLLSPLEQLQQVAGEADAAQAAYEQGVQEA